VTLCCLVDGDIVLSGDGDLCCLVDGDIVLSGRG
jgi:hypothetical protein